MLLSSIYPRGVYLSAAGAFSCDYHGIFTYFRPFSGDFPESSLGRGGEMIICD